MATKKDYFSPDLTVLIAVQDVLTGSAETTAFGDDNVASWGSNW